MSTKKVKNLLERLMTLMVMVSLAFATACGDDGETGKEEPEPPQPPTPVVEVEIVVEQTAATWEDVEISFSITGAERYYAGVEPKSGYFADTVLGGVASESYPAYTESSYTGSITAFPAENDIQVTPETTYVVWVVAENPEGLYTKADIYTKEVTSGADEREPEVSIEQVSASFNDIQIKVEMLAVESYYAGYELTSSFSAEEIILYANEDTFSAHNKLSYEGSIRQFPSIGYLEIMPDTSYTVWVLPLGKEEPTVDDLVTCEVSSAALSAGGSIAVTAGEPVIDATTLEVQLSAEGAEMLYYNYCSLSEAATMLDAESRIHWLLTEGQNVAGTTVLLSAENLLDDTNYVVMALAIDGEGKYGSLFYKAYKTEKLPFNDMVITIDDAAVQVSEQEASFSWSVSGGRASSYIYFVGRTAYTMWNTTLGGSVESAQGYISLHPDEFETTSGTSLKLTGLKPGAEYIFLVMAVDREGMYSVADSYTFTTSGTPQNFIARYNEDGSTNAAWSAYGIPAISFGNSFQRAGIYRAVWKVATVEGLKVYTVVSNPEFVSLYYPTAREWAEKIVTGGEDLGATYYCDVDGNNERKQVTSTEVTDGEQYYIYPYATSTYMVYVVWEDAEGNLYEAYSELLPELETEEE